jgi:hypothetical protein
MSHFGDTISRIAERLGCSTEAHDSSGRAF